MANAATPCEETLMPYLIPPRTPLTPEQVKRAFGYVLAPQMAGGSASPGGRKQTRSWRSSSCGWLRKSTGPSRPWTGTPTRVRTPSRWTRSSARCCPCCGAPPPRRRASRAGSSAHGEHHPGPDHEDTADTLPDGGASAVEAQRWARDAPTPPTSVGAGPVPQAAASAVLCCA